MAEAEIGVFGGSGFYSFLEDVEEVELETPFGRPSAPVTIGEIGGKSVAFLPRHGRSHELPPHRIPYRANVWAMRELGVRRILLETAADLGIKARDGGTVVTIQGPRFSTRAESRWFQAMSWEVINMTAYPEGWLARELELCYANISMVTDYDVGVEGEEPVSHEAVVRVFNENNEKLRELLFAAIPKIGPQPDDVCANALVGARF